MDLAPGRVQDAYETFQRVIDQVDATIAAAEDRASSRRRNSPSRGGCGQAAAALVAGRAPASSMLQPPEEERFQVMEEAIGTAHGTRRGSGGGPLGRMAGKDPRAPCGR